MHSSGKTDTGIKRNNNQDSIFFSDTPSTSESVYRSRWNGRTSRGGQSIKDGD